MICPIPRLRGLHTWRPAPHSHTCDHRESPAAHACDPFPFPHPSPADAPPPPAPCVPKTVSYYNPDDCRNYTLYDVDLKCPRQWCDAEKYCKEAGLELAPWDDKYSFCEWGDTDRAKSTPRSKAYLSMVYGSAPPYGQVCRVVLPSCRLKSSCVRSHLLLHMGRVIVHGFLSIWPNLFATEQPISIFLSADALDKLCGANKFCCWVGGASDPGKCPLIDSYGNKQHIHCNQLDRWVCRTKGEFPDETAGLREKANGTAAAAGQTSAPVCNGQEYLEGPWVPVVLPLSDNLMRYRLVFVAHSVSTSNKTLCRSSLFRSGQLPQEAPAPCLRR